MRIQKRLDRLPLDQAADIQEPEPFEGPEELKGCTRLSVAKGQFILRIKKGGNEPDPLRWDAEGHELLTKRSTYSHAGIRRPADPPDQEAEGQPPAGQCHVAAMAGHDQGEAPPSGGDPSRHPPPVKPIGIDQL